ncbi:antibiotic biosynthesis monooxygenase family protein [uncultured Propionivibrio sp.]|uniref:antibiotic biosynthesis monooxygenase family protein n=1 Tax=uncultured Propionivibrio sp. TaxID=426737 RepID=UPI0029C07526|nr:antibiotic biosynthesis monooxygenase family protein [uncultured Propionivibrio sp.]
MFKVILKRTVPASKEKELLALITQLRVGASGQEGYISGETLHNAAKPEEYVVISIWDSGKSWRKWLESEARIAVQTQIDELLGTPTICETYVYPHMTHSV